jgi:hypothetical protein
MTDAKFGYDIVPQKVLLEMARVTDETKLREMFDNNVELLTTPNGLNIFHLAAFCGNTVLFGHAPDIFIKRHWKKVGGPDGHEGVENFAPYLTAMADVPAKNGPPKKFTVVHVAVLMQQVGVLQMLSYWQRQYDYVGYQAALGTPADEQKRPAALSKAMYGVEHPVSTLVHVIGDAAGVGELVLSEKQKSDLVCDLKEMIDEIEKSDVQCVVKIES